jgi:hypothetical protein
MNSNAMPRVIGKLYQSNAPYSNGLLCETGGCPAVYETDQGTYLVVGRRLNAAEKAGLSIDSIEDALEIPSELLEGLMKKLKR